MTNFIKNKNHLNHIHSTYSMSSSHIIECLAGNHVSSNKYFVSVFYCVTQYSIKERSYTAVDRLVYNVDYSLFIMLTNIRHLRCSPYTNNFLKDTLH